MLIKVFGIWLMASNITYLSPSISVQENTDVDNKNRCYVSFTGDTTKFIVIYNSCEDTAKEINRQLASTNTPK